MQLLQELIIWLSLPPTVWIFAGYLVLINFLALSTMWWDKRRARNDGWRVSEATLFAFGFIGGAIGLIIGMFGFRHKTRKALFQFVIVLGLITSLFLYWLEMQAIYWHLYFV
ncbi:MAG: DUF1294 domain-containing protein [Candidatus Thorarchaeota archaeon]